MARKKREDENRSNVSTTNTTRKSVLAKNNQSAIETHLANRETPKQKQITKTFDNSDMYVGKGKSWRPEYYGETTPKTEVPELKTTSKNLRERGYSGSTNNQPIDFNYVMNNDELFGNPSDGMGGLDKLDADYEARKKERNRSDFVNEFLPFLNGLSFANSAQGKEHEKADNESYYDRFGMSKDQVLDQYGAYKEAQIKKAREENPYTSGFGDFKTAPDRSLLGAATNLANSTVENSTLAQILSHPYLQQETNDVQRYRDYSYDSDKLSDTNKEFVKAYNEGGDYLSNKLAQALMSISGAAYDPSAGFGAIMEGAKTLPKVLGATMQYGAAAQNTIHDLEKRGVDTDKARGMANVSGGVAAASDLFMGKAFKAGSSFLTNVLKSAGINLGRQSIQEIADRLILDDQGTYQTDVNNYMANGMSEEDAGAQAASNVATRLLGSAATGGIVGAVQGLLGLGANKVFGNTLPSTVDNLNNVYDIPNQAAIGQNNSGVPALSGMNQFALPESQLPIQLPGSGAPIQLPGTNGVIELGDLAATSAPISQEVTTALQPLQGEALAVAKDQYSKIRVDIKNRKAAVATMKETLKSTKANNAKIKAAEKEIKELEKQSVALDRQIKGKPTPIKEQLSKADYDSLFNSKAGGVDTDINYAVKYAGDSAEAKALSSELKKRIRNFVESGDTDELKGIYETARQLDELAVATDAEYTNSAIKHYNDYFGDSNLAESIVTNNSLGKAYELAQKQRNQVAANNTGLNNTPKITEEVGKRAPKESSVSDQDNLNNLIASKKTGSVETSNGQIIEKYSLNEMKNIIKGIKENGGLGLGEQLDILYKDGTEVQLGNGDDVSNIKLNSIDGVVWRNENTDAFYGNVSAYPNPDNYWYVVTGQVSGESAPSRGWDERYSDNPVTVKKQELPQELIDRMKGDNYDNQLESVKLGTELAMRGYNVMENGGNNNILNDEFSIMQDAVAHHLATDLIPASTMAEAYDIVKQQGGSVYEAVKLAAEMSGTKMADSAYDNVDISNNQLPTLVNPDSVTDSKRPYSIGIIHGRNGRNRYIIQENIGYAHTRPVEPGVIYETEDDARQALLRVEKNAGREVPTVEQQQPEPSQPIPNVTDNGYWLRILGDNDYLMQEAQKANINPAELRETAMQYMGYGEPTASESSSNNVPPTNNTPPTPPKSPTPPKPPKNNDGDRERSTSRKIRGVGKMRYDVPDAVKQDFIDDPDMYKQLSNKSTLQKAERIYQTSDDPETDFRQLLGRHDPASLPLGRMIAKEYSANGNHAAAAQIYRDMGEQLTKAGQFSQAAIINMVKNDPLTALEYARRQLDAMNKQGSKEFGKKWRDLAFTQDEIDAFKKITPGDEEALKVLFDKIGSRLGKEYPTTLMEKAVEGRKVAMLFNMRTISRNFFANPPTEGMRFMSDRLEGLGQSIVHLIDPSFEKTQTAVKVGGKGLELAKQFANSPRYKELVNGVDEKHSVPDLKGSIINNKQMFKGTAASRFIDKYTAKGINALAKVMHDNGITAKDINIDGGLQALNKKIAGKEGVDSLAETIRNLTYKLLDVTDSPFVKNNFVGRLASYLNAQGITSMDKIPDEAIQVAWDAALKATYKDNSWAVKALKGVREGINKVPVIGKPLSQALIPFLQAPGNIGARMVDYSSVNGIAGVEGIIEGAIKKDHGMIRKGIERLAKGLTGTALVYAGMKLKKAGIITGPYSSDQRERSYQKQEGFKPFAIHVGDKYFTYSWMQPFAMNLMIGSLIQEAIDNSDKYDSDILRYFGQEGSKLGQFAGTTYEAGKTAINTWFDETPLGDLKELFGNTNGSDTDYAQNIVDIGTDFGTAMYPATLNAAAKTIDTTQRQTKDYNNKFATLINEQIAKIPYLSKTLPEKYNTWGEEMEYADNKGWAFAQRFVIPGEYSRDSSDPLDKEVMRLFESTGDKNAFPMYAPSKVGDKKLSAREYSTYQKDMGERAKMFAQAFVDSDLYKTLPDEDRVENLSKLYYISKQITERDKFDKPVPNSSEYKKYIELYDAAGGGEKGTRAVIDKLKVANNEYGLSEKAYNEAVKAGEDLTKYAGYKEALEQSGLKDSAARREEYVNGGAKAIQSEGEVAGLLSSQYGITGAAAAPTYIKAQTVFPSLTLDQFAKTFTDIAGQEGDSMTISQNEITDYANAHNYTLKQTQQLWNAYGSSGWKQVPYVNKDGKIGHHTP